MTVRTFVAVRLSPPVRGEVSRFLHPLKPEGPQVKWVADDLLHLTLRFFGDLDETRVEKACQVSRELADTFGPIRARLGGTGTFPPHGRPRVYWIGLREGGEALLQLAGSLDRGYRSAGLGQADRPFSPHLTVGRAKPTRGKRPPVGPRVREFRSLTFESSRFIIDRVCVVRSDLTPHGPTYTPIGDYPLSGRG
jgi:2'-5' RNA ligase